MNGTARLNNATYNEQTSKIAPGQYFSQPGSFPYPTTITLDRHGGNPAEKQLYCYRMDDNQRIVTGSAFLNEEERGFGGTIVNPAPSIFMGAGDAKLGGFDGGTGGCACLWENFQKVANA